MQQLERRLSGIEPQQPVLRLPKTTTSATGQTTSTRPRRYLATCFPPQHTYWLQESEIRRAIASPLPISLPSSTSIVSLVDARRGRHGSAAARGRGALGVGSAQLYTVYCS